MNGIGMLEVRPEYVIPLTNFINRINYYSEKTKAIEFFKKVKGLLFYLYFKKFSSKYLNSFFALIK